MNRQYAISERAHFMCPNMNFGILLRIEEEFDESRLRDVIDKMSAAHPFLKAVMAFEEETGKLFYSVGPDSMVKVNIEEGPFDLSLYESINKKERDITKEGLLEVYIYTNSGYFEVVMLAHHLLVDGRGLLQLAQELADCYVEGKAPIKAEERLIADISELPEGSRLSGMSRFLVQRANKQWKKEKHKISYDEYLKFEREYNSGHSIKYTSYDISDDEYSSMCKLCHENDFSINDLLMAKMYIRTGCKKIIIAADIRNKFSNYRKGALGNYSTAMGIINPASAKDEVSKAREIHKTVKKFLSDNKKLMLVLACYFDIDPTLLDAAAISGMGGFESKAASFVGGGMFGFATPSSYSITNLGKIENRNIKSAMFIPPASPAAIFTLGVVTVNGKMYACGSANT